MKKKPEIGSGSGKLNLDFTKPLDNTALLHKSIYSFTLEVSPADITGYSWEIVENLPGVIGIENNILTINTNTVAWT